MSDTTGSTDHRKRHGLLTTALIFVIAANAMLLILYWFGRQSVDWTIAIYVILSVFNLICVGALFAWKKWGFWGICASTVIVLVSDLIFANGMNRALLGLVSIGLLYAGLRVGEDQKGWDMLD